MKSVIACCAVFTFACCAPAMSAPSNLFDGHIPRPPGSIPHARGIHAAAAPLPRPKPVTAPTTNATAPTTSAVAAPAGPIVFPPVTPLE